MNGQALIESAKDKLQSEDRPKNIRLLAFQAMTHLPARRIQPILDGLREGLTRKQAAGLAGMSLGELNFVIRLGTHGHPAWTEFVDALRIADSQSLSGTMNKLKEQAEDGNRDARDTYLKAKDPEFRESQEKSAAASGMNVGGINLIINKSFEPVNDDPTSPSNIVDADFEDIDE